MRLIFGSEISNTRTRWKGKTGSFSHIIDCDVMLSIYSAYIHHILSIYWNQLETSGQIGSNRIYSIKTLWSGWGTRNTSTGQYVFEEYIRYPHGFNTINNRKIAFFYKKICTYQKKAVSLHAFSLRNPQSGSPM